MSKTDEKESTMIKTASCIKGLIAHGLAALLLIGAALAHAQELTARVDRNKISIDDTFTLIIRSTAMSIFDSPDLAPLEQDFEVLGTSRNSQHSIINGKTQSSLEWHVSLAAKREGAVVIPPIEVDGKKTQAIVIEVSKSSFATNNSGFEPVFIESEIDSDSLYVQAQLIMTVRIFYAVALERGAQLSELDINNAVVKQINEAAYETKVNNMSYNVHEVKYAIFPQRSGSLEIPAQTFSALLTNRRRSGSPFDNFGSSRRGRPISAESQVHQVEVLPQAPGYNGKHWLPAEEINLLETWSKDLSELKAGEPITRSIIAEAIGLQGSQIPPLEIAEIQDAQQYPDQPETADEDTNIGVTGTRIESVAIIPAGGGTLTLPEVSLSWWNTNTNRQELATLPAQTLTLSGAPLIKPNTSTNAAHSVAAANTTNESPAGTALDGGALDAQTAPAVGKFWQYTTWLAVILWLATWAYFATRKPIAALAEKPKTTKVDSKAALRAIEKVAQNGKPDALRAAIITWAKQHTGLHSISALSSVASYFGNAQLTSELNALDAALYKGETGSFNGGQVVSAIKSAIESQPKPNAKKRYDLEPLYRA